MLLCVVALFGLTLAAAGTAGAQSGDRLEPNDDQSSAVQVSDGTTYEGLSITSDDSDYFAVEVEEGQTITSEILFSHDAADIDMELINPSGTAVAFSASVSDDERIEYTAEQSGTYYIRVYEFSGAPADYDFGVEVTSDGASTPTPTPTPTPTQTPTGGDRLEPNDDQSSAIAVSNGTTYEGLSITSGDSDYFAVDVQQGQMITPQIYFSDDAADIDMELINPSGESVAFSASVSDNEQISHVASQSGTYYVRVYEFSGAPADYDFELTLGTAGDADGADLRSISYGETASGELDAGDPASQAMAGYHENVTFQGTAGDVVTIEMTSETGDTLVGLFGPNGQLLTSNDDAGGSLNSRISEFALPANGTYTIVATSFDPSATFPYQLSLERTGTQETPDGDRLEPNDQQSSAVAVSNGTSYEGLSITRGDSDYFAIELEQGETVTPQIYFSDDAADIDMELIDPSGETVAGSASVSDNERIEHTAEQSGTYYVRVYEFSGAPADYDFEITTGQAATGGDRLEPNDAQSSAVAVSSGTTYDGLSITSGDSDYFAIELEQGQTITPQIYFSDDAADIDMELISPSGEAVAGSASVSDNERIEHTAEQSGTYYVRVYEFSGAPANYDFEITTGETTADEDRLEPNDQQSSAIAVSNGTTYEGLSITSGDSDYFAVDVTEGQMITPQIYFSGDAADIDMELINPSGESVAVSASVSDNEQITHVASQSGTYYVRVYEYSGAPANYDFELSVGESDVPQNGTDLRSIDYGETASGELDGGDPYSQAMSGYHENVTFQGTAGDVVTIEMTSETGDTLVGLFGPSGELIDSNDDAGGSLNSRIEGAVLPANGTYTIVATSFDQSATFPYQLSLERTGTQETPESDRLEPNDQQSSAVAVSNGTSYEGLSITRGDSDYFAIDVQQGQTITPQIYFSGDAADIDMELIGPSGESVASSVSVSDNERISHTAEQSGTYYVRVYEFSGAPAEYDFEITTGQAATGGADRLEPNDAQSSAVPVSNGTTYEGLSITRGDSDYFAIDVQQGQTITPQIYFSDDAADIDMELINPSGESVAFSASVSDNERISHTAEQSGTYYVRVYEFSGAPAEYDFEISVGEGGGQPLEGEPIAYGETVQDALDSSDEQSSNYYGYYDAWTFEGSAGDVVTIEMTSETGDTRVGLFGPNGQLLTSNDDAGGSLNSRISGFALPADGQYTIVATSFDSEATFPYELSLERTGTQETPDGDRLEPNDNPSSAVAVSAGTTYEGLSITSGDSDYFAIEAQQGQTIAPEILFSDDAADIDMELINPSGESVASSVSVSDNERISYTAEQSGTYYVHVYEFSGAPAEYDIAFGGSGETGSDALSMNATASQSVTSGNVAVNLSVTNTGDATQAVLVEVGPALSQVPGDWQVVERTDAGGAWRDSNSVWLFQSVEPGETVSPQVVLAPPEDTTGAFSMTFSAQSDTASVSDTATVTLTETTVASAVDQNDNGVIDDGEILDAINWWRNDQPIPGTDLTISNQQILDLTNLWQENEPYQ